MRTRRSQLNYLDRWRPGDTLGSDVSRDQVLRDVLGMQRQLVRLDIKTTSVTDRVDELEHRIDTRIQTLTSKVDGIAVWKHRLDGGLLAIGAFLAFAVIQLIAEALPRWAAAMSP